MNNLLKQAVVLIVVAMAGTPAVAQPQDALGGEGYQSPPNPVGDQHPACSQGELAPWCYQPLVRTSRPVKALPAANGSSHRLLTPEEDAQMGDVYGSRAIPPEIKRIMSDKRIDPITAYLLQQAARKPIGDWTMQQAAEITQVLPTLVESGISVMELQVLYKFLGLDPNNLYEPQLGADWQKSSTTFSAPNYASASSADCQADSSMMTVSQFAACSTDNSQEGNAN